MNGVLEEEIIATRKPANLRSGVIQILEASLMFKFWNTNKVSDITKVMSEQLISQYSLGEDNLKGLRYASRPGKFSGAKATYVRIFDPALLKNGVNLVQRYDDLTNQVAAIRFEARLVGDRLFDLFDRRPTAVELPYPGH